MNRDGTVWIDDLRLWAEWLFFLPGDALIAYMGPTALGGMLQLTPASFGTSTPALLSTVLWLFGIWLLFAVVRFIIDAADPTFLAERRERRQAAARARRALKERQRAIYRGRFLRRFGAWLIAGPVILLVAGLAVAIVKDVL